MGIKTKILIPMVTLTLFVAAAILTSYSIFFSKFVKDSVSAKVDSAAKVAASNLEFLKKETFSAILNITANHTFEEAVAEKNHGKLLALGKELLDKTDLDFCTFTDASGRVLLRAHAPDSHGDSLAALPSITTALAGKTTTVIEAGTAISLAIRASTPVIDQQGKIVGTVALGYRLDTQRFVDEVKRLTGCEVSIFLGTSRVSTTVLQNNKRAIGTQLDAHTGTTVLAGGIYRGEADILGRPAVAHIFPLFGSDAQPIGMILVGQYADATEKSFWNLVQNALLITGALLALAIPLILFVTQRIVTPIQTITRAASALALGDTEITIQVNTKDETKALADAFNRMLENFRLQVDTIHRIAVGDASISLPKRSEKDLLNRALEKLHATIQAQAAALQKEYERARLMLNSIPLSTRLWDKDINLIDCNESTLKMFQVASKQEYIDNYSRFAPEFQPDGQTTLDKIKVVVTEAFEKGRGVHEWLYQLSDGTPIPSELTLVCVPYGDDFAVASYSRDLREYNAVLASLKHRDKLLMTVNESIEQLLRSEPESFSDALRGCMGRMARSLNASRMYLHKNYLEGGKLYSTQLYEWREDGLPRGEDTKTACPFCDEFHILLKGKLCRGESINVLARDLPLRYREFFNLQNALAVMIVPVLLRDEFWGFVGFDNCRNEQLFSPNEESIMRSGTLLVASALLRNESLIGLKETSNKLSIALESAEEANKAKSNFLAQMSHEIRTPLNAVIGLSELTLSEQKLNSETEGNLEKIYNAGATILSIVNDILDLSKIESGKFEFNPIPYDTPSVINDIVVLNAVRIGEKNITFALHVDENLPGMLYGDDLRVKQIFNNLLSNAFKFTESGIVEWRISFEQAQEAIWLVSSVRDTGLGIKPEDMHKLFSDYSQVDTATNRKFTGTGLGLAITKYLVEMMDGSISVESEYGKGTVFHVRLRQTAVPSKPVGKNVAESLANLRYTISRRSKRSQVDRVNLSYARVLIVDDLETNLDVAKGMMKAYALQIDCATSGQQAVDMIRAGHPRYDAVFMDHMMPGMDGVEATRIIRETIDTDYARSVPIIALTANAILGNEEMFLSCGFQDFISKPIDLQKLDMILRRWVRDKTYEQNQAGKETALAASGGNSETGTEEVSAGGIAIDGVDMKRALERFGGDASVLHDILRSYVVNTRQLLHTLEEYLAAENLKDYAIVIHGIRGASYGICAHKAGKRAEALEFAAQAGNMAVVKAGHSEFMTGMGPLLEALDAALTTMETGADKPSAAAPDPELLRDVREACARFDMDGVDKAMARLESFRYERDGHIVAWLRERVNAMDFEIISESEI